MLASRWLKGISGSRLFWFGVLFFLLLGGGAAAPAEAGTFSSATYNGRTYKIYVPDGYSSGTAVPLVVMLHGCTQDADSFAAGTQMNAVADAETFIAIYPVQPTSANSSKCWNWFETAHQSRGSGEPALIAGMVNQVKGNYNIDDDRVYVTGLSSGGAMSVILGATYPDVFAAIGVGSGLEYKAATNSTAAWTAMFSGGPNATTQGNAAYSAMGSYARVVPVMVFHGSADYTVVTVNGDLVLSQWAQTNDRASDGSDNDDIDDTPEATISDSVPGGRSFTRYVYEDSSSQTVMEKYIVTGMGHAWSGGSTAGSYTDPNGPDASQLMVDFFMAHSMNGSTDTTPPTTTAAPGGGTYTGSVTVALSVNETATTYYTTDGSTPTTGSAVYSSPLLFNNTTTLKFFSVDSAANQETVKTETYTIEEPGPNPTPTPTPTPTPSSDVTVELTSIAAEDGYAGKYLADGYSSATHKVGDKGMFNNDTFRGLLSFDASGIPSGATITAVTLRIYRQSMNGTVTAVDIDIVSGAFGGNTAVQSGDYGATASASAIASFAPPSSNGSSVDVGIPSNVWQYINRNGRTQFRLRGTSAWDFTSDVFNFYGGDGESMAPVLIVTYEV